jgi:hypothetical protein
MMNSKSSGPGETNNYLIINISSVHERTPKPESAQYATSIGYGGGWIQFKKGINSRWYLLTREKG